MRKRVTPTALVGLTGLVLQLVSLGRAEEPRSVSFCAADGLHITADYYPPPTTNRGAAPIVILLHMEDSDRKAWEPLIAPLQGAGFATLALDLRGHGDSATTETREAARQRDPELFQKMQEDLRGAYDWLTTYANVDRARFALVGAGAGCSLAFEYAAKDRSVDALVCLSPELNAAGLDAVGDVRQITGRQMLFLAREAERDAPYTLAKATRGADVRIYKEGRGSGTDLLGQYPGFATDIASFLKTAVGEPSTDVVYGSINSSIFHAPDSGWVKQIASTNLRYYSSPREAEARGLRSSKSKGPGKGQDRGAGPGGRPASTP